MDLCQFEIFIVLYFAGVVVVRDLGDVQSIVGFDVETQQHFFIERYFALGVCATYSLAEGFSDGEGTQHVEA